MAFTYLGQEILPSASRLIHSLRDMGYEFAEAVADLVDNSIAAAASVISIDVEFDGKHSWVRIVDNGKGMTDDQLLEAMRYGSEREYQKSDLGKFGLGLKTASLSQCQKLSVASRSRQNKATIEGYCWDLAHIEKVNKWEVIPLDGRESGPSIFQPLEHMTGTAVLWQRLDRILAFNDPYGEPARKKVSAMCRELEEHLSMVFHRFMSGDVPEKKLTILLNGNQLKPWDPFARTEKRTLSMDSKSFKVDIGKKFEHVEFDPFILPAKNQFSSPEAFTRASGPANWNQQQGFYIYRADRLIQSGGWCRLRTSDEHSKLARIALSFSPALDQAFKINVAKMRVQLPPQIIQQVDDAIKPVVKAAQERYRTASAKKTAQLSNPPILKESGIPYTPAPPPDVTPTPSASGKKWTLDEIQHELEATARLDERPVVKKVFARFRKNLSDI